jgi:hypothetical protein
MSMGLIAALGWLPLSRAAGRRCLRIGDATGLGVDKVEDLASPFKLCYELTQLAELFWGQSGSPHQGLGTSASFGRRGRNG